ncbi:MAG: cysteine desulfurase [Bacteroidetes bacterium GWA2_31_9]|nr:MAG: cysteine desulfurase [Bacteroidetes bacterium GWA2_31_9]
MRIYFDNTASTPIYPEVIELMTKILKENFGNPSSIHHFGRQSKVTIENARKKIAGYLNAAPSEIFFTSGGTEANNMAISGAINDLKVEHVITSPIEHHAILHTLEHYENIGKVKVHFIKLDDKGRIILESLEKLLKQFSASFVTLMHANNEISNLLPIKEVSKLCREYDAIFHSDMVQSVCHYKIDFQKIDIDMASSSGHKFHAPKGVGFIYINGKRLKINPFIIGGGQERNMRGGTENIAGIAALAKAFEISHQNMEEDEKKIRSLKSYMVKMLSETFQHVDFIGDSMDKGLYTVLSVAFPENVFDDMLLMNLDMEGIAASSGSACTSGALKGSHVINHLGINPDRQVIRFSFSKFNTFDEIDFCINVLKKLNSKS